jgi:quercetin dioxygenase-like cupin family protein
MEITRPDQVDSQQGPADWFTGDVTIRPIARQPAPGRAQAAVVSFRAGARTAWHTHPFGQILHILEGRARVQAAGSEVVELEAGSSVRFAADENHWHGATPHTPMAHVAIQEANEDGVSVVWGRYVTDAEYAGGD